nr:mitochondrial dicarboxylate carrier [Tanacetum cinerariifolium]
MKCSYINAFKLKAAEAVKRRNEMLKRPNFGLYFAFGNKPSKRIRYVLVAVIKTRVMNVKVAEEVEPPYKGVVDCAVNIVKAEGQERDAGMKTYLQLLLLLPLLEHGHQ